MNLKYTGIHLVELYIQIETAPHEYQGATRQMRIEMPPDFQAPQDRTKAALSSMRKILRATELNARTLMAQTGLTPSQLIFMQMLDNGEEQTAGHVAARMGITQATITVLIHKLEAIGMVRRRKGDLDRRQVWLSLTDKARNVLSIAPDGVHAQFHDRFSRLEEWEQLMLISALERVAGMIGLQDTPEAMAVLEGSSAA